jgi:hypothetical protein
MSTGLVAGAPMGRTSPAEVQQAASSSTSVADEIMAWLSFSA